MAGPAEIPELTRDFVEMAKGYVRQETLEPAKALGRLTGYGLLAGLVWAVAALFLIFAGHRVIIEWFPDSPDHQILSGTAYLVSGLLWVACGGIVAYLTSRAARS